MIRMDYQLNGKLAYVSAGAHGIGEAIADLLTREGAAVIVGDLDDTALKEKAQRWRGTVAANLAAAAGVEKAVGYVLESFGRAPDILINNLGVADSTPFEQISDDKWAQSIQVNLMGTVRTCRALVPKMAARGSGVVVNTGSDLAKQPEPGCAGREGQRGSPRSHLVQDVDEARWHRRSAGAALRARSRRLGEAFPRRSTDADGHWPS